MLKKLIASISLIAFLGVSTSAYASLKHPSPVKVIEGGVNGALSALNYLVVIPGLGYVIAGVIIAEVVIPFTIKENQLHPLNNPVHDAQTSGRYQGRN